MVDISFMTQFSKGLNVFSTQRFILKHVNSYSRLSAELITFSKELPPVFYEGNYHLFQINTTQLELIVTVPNIHSCYQMNSIQHAESGQEKCSKFQLV